MLRFAFPMLPTPVTVAILVIGIGGGGGEVPCSIRLIEPFIKVGFQLFIRLFPLPQSSSLHWQILWLVVMVFAPRCCTFFADRFSQGPYGKDPLRSG